MARRPRWVPRRYAYHWRYPWRKRSRNSKRFRSLLRRHGYLSPHFTIREASCKHCRRPPRDILGAQRQAFKLEKLRHQLGDRAVRILSWYRCPTHNRNIGGASQSRHMVGDATDFDTSWLRSVGVGRFDQIAERIWRNNGIGRYPSGARHTDARSYRARWSSF